MTLSDGFKLFAAFCLIVAAILVVDTIKMLRRK